MSDPVFEYSRFGFSFAVFDNRIETSKGWLGPLKKRETLLLRNVTQVDTPGGITGQHNLDVTMADGGKRRYNLGRRAGAARDAIVTLL